MIRMDTQSIKINLIHWLVVLEDMSVLEKIQSAKEKKESFIDLNAEKRKEQDSKLDKHENREMKFSSWDTVKNIIWDRVKDAL